MRVGCGVQRPRVDDTGVGATSLLVAAEAAAGSNGNATKRDPVNEATFGIKPRAAPKFAVKAKAPPPVRSEGLSLLGAYGSSDDNSD
jgi:hypothetical protein